MQTLVRLLAALAVTVAALPTFAQQTTGTITGRVIDPQETAVPGATITATNTATGLVRTDVSDSEGLYHLNALPVGAYDIVAELPGFTRLERKDIAVDVSQTTVLNMMLRLAQVAETVTVVGDTPLIPTTSSSVGQVVDLTRIERLPLNGRQFANLAATVPGVGLGFHSDPTKATEYSPQISGGNGRNVDYIVDGGDNNDDTIGGLAQMYPLEGIQQFNVMTQRFDAQYGRGAGVLNVVTKSGTNDVRGSAFTLFRDTAMNATTESETLNHLPKQDYRRYQYGGSLGGPILPNKVFYFGAFERTQQDTKQTVNTLGLFPSEDGTFPVPVRENLFTGKLTADIRAGHYIAVRYGYDGNSSPSGAGLRAAHSTWATSTNRFHSINANDSWLFSGTKLNDLIFQVATFKNAIPGSTTQPVLMFPNGVSGGANAAAPQATEQVKWQLRDDVSWTAHGIGGLEHNMKVGGNWLHEPRLFISTQSGVAGFFTMGANAVNGPVQQVQVIGGAAEVNIPLDFYSGYVQDDWRATSKLTLNLGVRYDYVSGMPLNQDRNPNFTVMQAAGAAGRFTGTVLDDFGKSPRGDTNNVQPRLGAVYDLRGNGHDIVRAGWGIYTDFAYTNQNALNAAIDAAGGAGIVFVATNPAGIRKADGTFFQATDPLSTIASQNLVNTSLPPLGGQVQSPRLQQPYTRQANVGWMHQLDPSTALSVDVMRADGRNINTRLRINQLVNGRRYLADLSIQPNSNQFRVALSKGTSVYQAFIIGLNRRMSHHLDVSASYTLANATSIIGSASDENDANLVQDVRDPFAPVQNAPLTRTDARHRVSLSAIVEAPFGIDIAPIYLYQSSLPTHSFEGLDLNADGNNNDKTATAYRFTGLNADGTATFKEIGACATVNCSWRAPYSQMNLRLSKGFGLRGGSRVEAIAEVFNLFNAKNPSIPLTTRRLSATGAALSSFMQPTAYAGDFGQPEQRVGQIGFRVTF
ncbi:MAG TPA: carboxypeptidase regulatory-like domain-containing protein [Vicinamibacterales bacterium]